MSYGTSAVILKPDNDNNIPFIFIGGFDGMNWHMSNHSKSPERAIQHLNNQCKEFIKKPNGVTTLEKLLTAPLDEVIIITGESSYESMKDRKPLNCSKGSGNEYWYTHTKEYLTGIKENESSKKL